MITDIGAMFTAFLRVMQIPLTIYGFTFSMWEVFLFTAIASCLLWVLMEVIWGDD